jgi:hypothetical protein
VAAADERAVEAAIDHVALDGVAAVAVVQIEGVRPRAVVDEIVAQDVARLVQSLHV